MNKQWKSTIILGSIIVVLLLVWLASSLIPGMGEPDETTTGTTERADPVFKTEMTDIQYLDVTNDSGSYKLVPESVTDDDGEVSLIWRVDGMEDYPFASSTVENLANVAGHVYASEEIATDVTDLGPFGLDQPSGILKVVLKNGETHEIKFGKELPSGYYDYVMLDDTGRICSVASTTADRVRSSLLDLLDKSQVIGLDVYELQKMVFERAKDELYLATDIELIGEPNSGSEYFSFAIREPVHRDGSSEGLTTLLNESTAVQVDSFVELDPEDLSSYGLDQPRYAFTLSTADKTVVLKIGDRADGETYYAMSDAFPAVFTVKSGDFTAIDKKVTELIDRFVCLESIWTVSKIEADILGTSFVVDIEMEKEQKPTDEDVVYMLDGKDARIFSESKKSLFSNFYQRIIGILIEDLDPEADPVNTKDARLVFHIKEDTENQVPAHTKVVEFARRDEYTYYVFIDGVYGGYYVDGEKAFTSERSGSEGILVAYEMLSYAIEHAVDGVFDTQEGYHLD